MIAHSFTYLIHLGSASTDDFDSFIEATKVLVYAIFPTALTRLSEGKVNQAEFTILIPVADYKEDSANEMFDAIEEQADSLLGGWEFAQNNDEDIKQRGKP
jgi:hypothetical protein